MSRFNIRRNNNMGTVEVMDGTDILFSLQPISMKPSDALFIPHAKMKSRVVHLPLGSELGEVRRVLLEQIKVYVQDLGKVVAELEGKK